MSCISNTQAMDLVIINAAATVVDGIVYFLKVTNLKFATFFICLSPLILLITTFSVGHE